MFVAALVFAGCIAFVTLIQTAVVLAILRRERDNLERRLSDALSDFATSPDENTPSPLAVIMDQAAMLLAARLAQQLKAMLAGVESGESKAEQLAMFEGVASQNPLVGVLGAILPKRIRSKLLSNPQMLGALGRLGGGGGGGGGNHEAPGAITRKRRE